MKIFQYHVFRSVFWATQAGMKHSSQATKWVLRKINLCRAQND